MWEPDRGNVDTSGVTSAYAAGARQKGADIYRFTTVTGLFIRWMDAGLYKLLMEIFTVNGL